MFDFNRLSNFTPYDKHSTYSESIKNDENKKIDIEKVKFYNSLYSKDDLSDYILVNKKPRTIKKKIND